VHERVRQQRPKVSLHDAKCLAERDRFLSHHRFAHSLDRCLNCLLCYHFDQSQNRAQKNDFPSVFKSQKNANYWIKFNPAFSLDSSFFGFLSIPAKLQQRSCYPRIQKRHCAPLPTTDDMLSKPTLTSLPT
jgi:hypothetical protein